MFFRHANLKDNADYTEGTDFFYSFSVKSAYFVPKKKQKVNEF